MKATVYRSLLIALFTSVLLFGVNTAEAKYHCKWVRAHWHNGYYHHAHKVCWHTQCHRHYHHHYHHCGW